MEGVRDNQLVGYGLVIGLNGTGDRLRSAVFTRQSLVGMLERLGVNTRDFERQLDTKNVAAVMVTANLPAFARPGSRIDVGVSALGDATNLTGGTLLVTPLLGADGEVYAVAQGAMTTGAISARGAGASISRGVPTAGRPFTALIQQLALRVVLDEDDQLVTGPQGSALADAPAVALGIGGAQQDVFDDGGHALGCRTSQKLDRLISASPRATASFSAAFSCSRWSLMCSG